MFNQVYTLVFARELPDMQAVRQVKRDLLRLFETEEVSTSDNRRFSFATTLNETKAGVAVDLFSRDQRRKFVMNGLTIAELGWGMCGNMSRW